MASRQNEVFRVPVSTNGAVQAYLSRGEGSHDFAVVYVHGFGSTRQGIKAQVLELVCEARGWPFAAFDFRGHGESTGTMLELRGSRLLEDLEAVHRELLARGIRRLLLVGSSMGGWASGWFAIRHPEAVTACAMMAPALDFIRQRWTRLTDAQREAFKASGRHRVQNEWVDIEIGYGIVEEIDQFPVEKLIAAWAAPLLIIHGMRDDTIPYTQSLEFVRQSPHADMELRLFKNGDHRLLDWKEEMAEAACGFFERVMKRPV
jgi:pimeloyl-ACP methyl ester carboxylesterase